VLRFTSRQFTRAPAPLLFLYRPVVPRQLNDLMEKSGP
jgi:hypothetical protein